MSEFLVITTRQSVLDVIDHLRGAEHVRINVESDFTRGLKAIFYGLPEVVFIQDEIAGISGEKVAGQVKNLLEGEPIRLVLLREHPGDGDSDSTGFDGVIDIGLPFNELSECFRHELGILPGSVAEPQPEPETDRAAGEFTLDLTAKDNGLEFDPFSDVFPAKFHPSWGPDHSEAALEPAVDELHSKDNYEPSPFEEEFSFDPPGDIVTSIPLDKPSPHAPVADGGRSVSPVAGQEAGSDPSAGMLGEWKSARLADKESPHQLFASMSDDGAEESPPQEAESAPAAVSVGERLRLKGIEPRSSLKIPETVGSAPALSAAVTSPSPRQPSMASSAANARSPRSGPPPRPVLPESDYMARGFATKRSLSRMVLPSLLLVLLGFATYLSVVYWDDLTLLLPGGNESIVPPPPPPPPQKATVALRTSLPEFFPKVPQDATYAADHPGWERYLSGGLQYLAYRENGIIRALQVVAGKDGRMDEQFLADCIRQTTGRTGGVKWISEERDGFLVEKGALSDREEVAVYRKMPEGEIRGVVLTFR